MLTIHSEHVTLKFPDINEGDYLDINYFENLATTLAKHFSPGLIVTVKNRPLEADQDFNYLYLENQLISPDQLFDEFWKFREDYWFKLPKKITRHNHITLKY